MRKLCTLLNSRLNEPVMGASCWLWTSVVVAVGRPASSRTALPHPGRRHSVHHRFSFLHCLWPCFGEENDMSVILFTGTFFQEKQDTLFLIITSANEDWFSKFGHSDFQGNFVHTCYKISTSSMCVSALPWRTWKFHLCQFQWHLCMWDIRVHLTRYVAF